MNQTSKQPRIFAISLSSRGFGYAVMEGPNRIVDCGHKVFNNDKNVRSLANIQKMIIRSQPDVLVLQAVNVKGFRRALRIKKLHAKVVTMAKNRKLKVMQISGTGLRITLLGDAEGTKHEMAGLLAQRFPDELSSCLPPKRKTWDSEDARMDIFDAMGLAAAVSAPARKYKPGL